MPSPTIEAMIQKVAAAATQDVLQAVVAMPIEDLVALVERSRCRPGPEPAAGARNEGRRSMSSSLPTPRSARDGAVRT